MDFGKSILFLVSVGLYRAANKKCKPVVKEEAIPISEGFAPITLATFSLTISEYQAHLCSIQGLNYDYYYLANSYRSPFLALLHKGPLARGATNISSLFK